MTDSTQQFRFPVPAWLNDAKGELDIFAPTTDGVIFTGQHTSEFVPFAKAPLPTGTEDWTEEDFQQLDALIASQWSIHGSYSF